MNKKSTKDVGEQFIRLMNVALSQNNVARCGYIRMSYHNALSSRGLSRFFNVDVKK